MPHCLRIANKAEAKGADHRSGSEVAEHGAEPQPLEEHHRDHRRTEEERPDVKKRPL